STHRRPSRPARSRGSQIAPARQTAATAEPRLARTMEARKLLVGHRSPSQSTPNDPSSRTQPHHETVEATSVRTEVVAAGGAGNHDPAYRIDCYASGVARAWPGPTFLAQPYAPD